MTLFLIRHGETPLNVARVLQPADTPLSPQGLRQAEAVAQRMAKLGIRRIVSSDLPRAWQTAACIATATGLPAEATPLLRERDFGALRGLPYDSLGFNPLTMAEAPTGGESTADFHARVAQAFAHVVQCRAECSGPLAVVTHGLVIRALLERHAQASAHGLLPVRLGNTSVSCIGAASPHAIELLDCTRHLDSSGTQDDAQSLSGG